MSNQITMAEVNKYSADVQMLIQQKKSRLETFVRHERQSAKFDFYEQIGPVAAQEYGPRHGDTPLMETPHLRRRNAIKPYIWADLIDDPDRLRILIKPDGAYTKNAVMAFNRRKDDIIIKAFTAPAFTGHEGNTSLDLPESQYIRETGTANLTIDKLIAIKTALWNDDMEDDEHLMMAVSPETIASLLKETKVTNSDYNSVKALVNGDIDTFMGFKFIRTNRLPLAEKTPGTASAGYIRQNYVWTKGSMLLATGQDIRVSIDKRPDKKNATQIMVTMDCGATRMEEKRVMVIETYEATKPANVPAP